MALAFFTGRRGSNMFSWTSFKTPSGKVQTTKSASTTLTTPDFKSSTVTRTSTLSHLTFVTFLLHFTVSFGSIFSSLLVISSIPRATLVLSSMNPHCSCRSLWRLFCPSCRNRPRLFENTARNWTAEKSNRCCSSASFVRRTRAGFLNFLRLFRSRRLPKRLWNSEKRSREPGIRHPTLRGFQKDTARFC